ncbi:GDSL esterase/lipase At1g54790-like [Argentina anserina]|uniref:GDSL esterase/lipase At1g54790-like n=1 Tax=Argentina anserina TaxID=57926 RepID=UPI00217662E8|nr:GDSL esterase/lipase At1g54790-like [Potentilla anserina]
MCLKVVFIVHFLALVSALLPRTSNIPTNLTYPAVFNFGDSNSDTGGIQAGVGFPIKRFCNGYLIIDYFVTAMNLSYLNPYLDSVGAPSFQTGCNFATGGATILPAKASSTNPFSFGIQVAQFSRFRARVHELLAKRDKKLQPVLPNEDYFKQGLYTFDVGQNDFDGAFYSKSEDQVVASIPAVLTEMETGFEKLYNQGARNFWIHNTGPLGCLPRIIATFGKDPSNLNQVGCVASHNRAATAFNEQLHDLCLKFKESFPEANVTYVDIFKIKLDLITNFAQYGFKQGIAACCGYGGPPINFDNRIACGQTKNLNGTEVTATPCSNPAEYVNWDGNHYTEAANQYVSSQILTGNYTYYLNSSIECKLSDGNPNLA